MDKNIQCPFCSHVFDPIDDFSEGITSGVHDVSCPKCEADLEFNIVVQYSVLIITEK